MNCYLTDCNSSELTNSSPVDLDLRCLLEFIPNCSPLACLSVSMAIINFTSPVRLREPPGLELHPQLSENPTMLHTKPFPESGPKHGCVPTHPDYCAATKTQWYFVSMMPMMPPGLLLWDGATILWRSEIWSGPKEIFPIIKLTWLPHNWTIQGSLHQSQCSPRGHKYFTKASFPCTDHFRLSLPWEKNRETGTTQPLLMCYRILEWLVRAHFKGAGKLTWDLNRHAAYEEKCGRRL